MDDSKGQLTARQTAGDLLINALDAALGYAAIGWHVFPCHSMDSTVCTCGKPDCRSKAKHPRTVRGCKDGTTDTEQIRHWWKKSPNANVGIATGDKSGIVVVDVDPRNGGDDNLDQLLDQYGPLPATVESETGGGGKHHIFQCPPGKCRKSIRKGIDTKADGGYIIASPSLHASGKRYKWRDGRGPHDIAVAIVPEWLRKMIIVPEVDSRTRNKVKPPRGTNGDDTKLATDALDALSVSRADDYESWVAVGMILHTVSDDLLVVWDRWSRRSDKFAEGECEAKWMTFHAGGGAGLGTLVYWAKQDGWTPTRRASVQTDMYVDLHPAVARATRHAVEHRRKLKKRKSGR